MYWPGGCLKSRPVLHKHGGLALQKPKNTSNASFIAALRCMCGCLQLQWEQGDSVQQVWVAVSCHVLHPHVWVRGIAARLLGLAFADDAIGAFPSPHWAMQLPFCLRPHVSKDGRVCRSSCMHLGL